MKLSSIVIHFVIMLVTDGNRRGRRPSMIISSTYWYSIA
jgi:hypothetical protein